jgi:hypothetical protein
MLAYVLSAGSLQLVATTGSPPPLQNGAGVMLPVGHASAEDASEWVFIHYGGLRSELNARPIGDVWLLAGGSWTGADVLAPPAHGHALVAAIDGRAYAFGGYGKSGWFRDLSHLTTFEITRGVDGLEVTTGRVEVPGINPGACAEAAAVAIAGGRSILYIGGSCSTDFPGIGASPGRLWQYSVSDNRWQRLSDLPVGLTKHSAVAFDDQVLVFGGRSHAGEVNSLFSYDLATDSWSELSPGGEQPGPRYGHGAVSVGQQMLVFGGIETPFFPITIGEIWSLDLRTQRWQLQGSYSDGLAEMAVAVLPGDPEAPRHRRALLQGGVIEPWSFPARLSDETIVYHFKLNPPDCPDDHSSSCLAKNE